MIHEIIKRYSNCKSYSDRGSSYCSYRDEPELALGCNFQTKYTGNGTFQFESREDEELTCRFTFQENKCSYWEPVYSSTDINLALGFHHAFFQSNAASEFISRILLGRFMPDEEQIQSRYSMEEQESNRIYIARAPKDLLEIEIDEDLRIIKAIGLVRTVPGLSEEAYKHVLKVYEQNKEQLLALAPEGIMAPMIENIKPGPREPIRFRTVFELVSIMD